MKMKSDNPGVHIPPPLFYVGIFFLSLLVQKYFPLPPSFFGYHLPFIITGFIFILAGILFLLPAVVKFLKTKNTLITIKPARSLQTTGIYAITRNPMYLGLLCAYTGVACFKGNQWTFIFIPLVMLMIIRFVIMKEEGYLDRAFGEEYRAYKQRVRRWI